MPGGPVENGASSVDWVGLGVLSSNWDGRLSGHDDGQRLEVQNLMGS